MKKIPFKKQALVLTMVAALGVAVYLNYYFSDGGLSVGKKDTGTEGTLGEAIFVSDGDKTADGGEEPATAVGAKVSYFDQARKNREKAREEAMDLIKDIAADIQKDATAAQKAVDATTALATAAEREAKVEGLVKAKGFEDCVAYIADGSCSVVVKADDLTGTQTLQISEIVAAQTDIPAQKINIMAVKS